MTENLLGWKIVPFKNIAPLRHFGHLDWRILLIKDVLSAVLMYCYGFGDFQIQDFKAMSFSFFY